MYGLNVWFDLCCFIDVVTRILSLYVTLLKNISTLIYAVVILLFCFFVSIQYACPYNIIGLINKTASVHTFITVPSMQSIYTQQYRAVGQVKKQRLLHPTYVLCRPICVFYRTVEMPT